MLLVEPGAIPPEVDHCVEDWIRLPAEERDIAARLRALSLRAERHHTTPAVDPHGRLLFGGRSVGLSPIEGRLAAVLAENFGDVVSASALMEAAWSNALSPASPGALRVHLTRMRRQLALVGLEILAVRSRGYVLQVQR